MKDREPFFFHPVALLANTLDPRFRGQAQSAQNKIEALRSLQEICKTLGLDPPNQDLVFRFMQNEGPQGEMLLLNPLI